MKSRLKFEHRFLLEALVWTLPPGALALALLWIAPISHWLQWGGAGAIALMWLVAALVLRRTVVRPLQTVSNLLAGLRAEDFSTRASGACANDALGEVLLEVNLLSTLLQEQRLGALEATALLRRVMEEIDVALFTFDHEQKLKLVNRAGCKLLAQPSERLLERTAGDLKLAHCLEGELARTMQIAFPGGMGRWSMRRSTFWQGGTQRHLLVMADLSRALREEERQAWQRLLRVLGHEINNSLAPIKSISGSLGELINKEPMPADWKEDMAGGLGVIQTRAESLGRFMATYTQLARLPQPKLQPINVASWLPRVVSLETRLPIAVLPGPEVTLNADSDQLEQLLINLLRNAVDAALQTPGGSPPGVQASNGAAVSVSWIKHNKQMEIRVEDNGPGLANTGNLFVPFFTTKPGGSGIGLVLCRQIAEAHGGTLSLDNREQVSGCCARLLLPLA